MIRRWFHDDNAEPRRARVADVPAPSTSPKRRTRGSQPLGRWIPAAKRVSAGRDGRPGVSRLLGDPPDAGLVQVAAADHQRVTSRVGQDRAKLLPATTGANIGKGTKMGRVDTNLRRSDAQCRHGRDAVRASVARRVWATSSRRRRLASARAQRCRRHGASGMKEAGS